MTARKLPAASRRQHRGHFGHKRHLDRGAAAVEMALVLPLLLFLLMGMIDFGRAYSGQIQLSAAAREGVRLASLNTTGLPADTTNPTGDTAIAQRVTSAAGGLPAFAATCASPTSTSSSVCITYCPTPAATASATVVVKSQFSWITGISGMSKFFGPGVFPTPTTLSSTGVMRCVG